MIQIHDWLSTSSPTRIPPFQNKLKRNTFIGTTVGLGATTLALSKGNIKNIPKISYTPSTVIALCAGTALGGLIGAETADKGENRKGRLIEFQNQFIFNDAIPTLILAGVDKLLKTKNKFLKSIALIGTLIASTFLSHKLSEVVMKKEGLKPSYPVKAKHFATDIDDIFFPIAVATKSKPLQNALKIATPFTYTPIGMNVGLAKNSDYFQNNLATKIN